MTRERGEVAAASKEELNVLQNNQEELGRYLQETASQEYGGEEKDINSRAEKSSLHAAGGESRLKIAESAVRGPVRGEANYV